MKKNMLLSLLFAVALVLVSCSEKLTVENIANVDDVAISASKVDPSTPSSAQPVIVSSPNTSSQLKFLPAGNWELDFTDEFDGTVINSSKWNIIVSSKSRAPRPDLGITDWWWKAENVWQENGELVLEVSKFDSNTMHCGSINSNNLYETQYGYFETRMKIADASKGTHTAFWFQGDNQSNVDGTANDGAEIDVFESAWLGDYTKSVLHIDGYGADHQSNTVRYDTPGIHEGYHVWGFHWTENFMDIYYDGVFKVRYDDPDWIVHAPEYLWLSDGASFGISGDYFTSQPNGTLTHAYVDYIRAWKEVPTTNNAPEITSPAAPTAALVGEAYTHTFSATDPDQGDQVTYSAPVLPSWLSFNETTGVLSGTPVLGDVGAHDVTLRATDGIANTDESFTITVSDTSNPTTIVVEGENASYLSPTGDVIDVLSSSLASNGSHVQLGANASGDRIRFNDINVSVSGMYTVSLSSLKGAKQGKYSCSISNNGTWTYFTPVYNMYSSTEVVEDFTFGSVYLDAGTHSITFQCEGKGKKGKGGFLGSFDKIVLTPQ
ncbi:glycosyl hydrolase family protein [Labilibacter sediminis]|nr:glycosyl hydrolase family protein [Labilibacter sediminis]